MKCKACGRPISDKIKKCMCGYDNEGWCTVEANDVILENKEPEVARVHKEAEKNQK